MSDLIDRGEATNAALNFLVEYCGAAFDEDMQKMLCERLDALPSVERKKGKWSNYKDEHCCSVCKCVVISDCWDDEIRYDYCPYCGAEME